MPLPQKTLLRGLKIQKNSTLSYSGLNDMLRRLREDGYVMRVDKAAADEGRIEPMKDTDGSRAPYYITEKGLQRIGVS
jgi:hypothetical protein